MLKLLYKCYVASGSCTKLHNSNINYFLNAPAPMFICRHYQIIFSVTIINKKNLTE